jgi:chromosome segregation ATPase
MRKTKRVKTKAAPARKKSDATRKKTSSSHRLAKVKTSAVSSKASKGTSVVKKRRTMSETNRDLKRQKKELLVRIKELELQRVGNTDRDEGNVEDYAKVSQESNRMIAMAKDLRRKIDVAHEHNDALEADLLTTQKQLTEERAVRAELEARINLLGAKAALGEQLRDDISFVEEERNETVKRLEEVISELELATEERDDLAKEKVIKEALIMDIQSAKSDLEAQTSNLKEKVADMNQLHQEFAQEKEKCQLLEEKGHDLESMLESAETSKNALDLDLTVTQERVRSQNKQIEELRVMLTTTRDKLTELRAQLDKREAENVTLRESLERKERELKTVIARNESIKKELDSRKKALHDIRSAAVRTTV